ncbi:hypothetical protein FHT76_008025 [Rhizobium sp. BK176]|nr:hypothetical protein [Rhizobium sp. BK181]MBB3545372.1 hypothetical protein [Rhizobium sp. BK399]MCS3743995.1 hypothetical protein [Rhizobium sp. BK661]MCS4096304.1 hypothetical protein [Rhizobium sp. BK176]
MALLRKGFHALKQRTPLLISRMLLPRFAIIAINKLTITYAKRLIVGCSGEYGEPTTGGGAPSPAADARMILIIRRFPIRVVLF